MPSQMDTAWFNDGMQLYDVFKVGEDNFSVKIAEIHDTSESYAVIQENGEYLLSETNDLQQLIEDLEANGYELEKAEFIEVVAVDDTATTNKGTLKARFGGSKKQGSVELRLDGNNGTPLSLGTFQYGYLPGNDCLHILHHPIYGKDREDLAHNVGKHLAQAKEAAQQRLKSLRQQSKSEGR